MDRDVDSVNKNVEQIKQSLEIITLWETIVKIA